MAQSSVFLSYCAQSCIYFYMMKNDTLKSRISLSRSSQGINFWWVRDFICMKYEPAHDKTNNMACAPFEDSDQSDQSECKTSQWMLRMLTLFCLFYGPWRLLHSLWAESIVLWGEKTGDPRKKTPDQQQWNDKWFRALKISILKGAADTYIKEPSAMGLQLFNKDWSLSLMMSQTIHYYDLLKTEHIGEIICNITNRNLQLQKANVYNLIF